MRKTITIISGFLVLLSEGSAEPWLAAREGKTCMTCHVSPSGTGVRNLEGREFSRAMAFPKGEADLHLEQPRLKVGEVPVNFGGDVRVNFESSKNSDTFTLLQSAFYAHVEFSDRIGLVYHADFSRASTTKEIFGLIGLDEAFLVKVGQFTLPYGLLAGDIRSLLSQGSGFGTHVQDVGAEINWQTSANGTGYFARGALTNGSGLGNKIRSFTAQMGMHTSGYALGLSGQWHRGDTGDRWRYGAFGWFRFLPFAILYELDSGQDPVTNAVPILTHTSLEIDWSPAVHTSVAYEWWDPDAQVAADDRQRTALNIRWLFAPYVEAVGTAAAVTRPTTGTSYEGILSLHFYY